MAAVADPVTTLTDSLEHTYWQKGWRIYALALLPSLQAFADLVLNDYLKSLFPPDGDGTQRINELQLEALAQLASMRQAFPKIFDYFKPTIPPESSPKPWKGLKRFLTEQIKRRDEELALLSTKPQVPAAKLSDITKKRDLIVQFLNSWVAWLPQLDAVRLDRRFTDKKQPTGKANVPPELYMEMHRNPWIFAKIYCSHSPQMRLVSTKEEWDISNLSKMIVNCPAFQPYKAIIDQLKPLRNQRNQMLAHNSTLTITVEQLDQKIARPGLQLLELLAQQGAFPYLTAVAREKMLVLRSVIDQDLTRGDEVQRAIEEFVKKHLSLSKRRLESIWTEIEKLDPAGSSEAVHAVLCQFLTPELFPSMKAPRRGPLDDEEVAFLLNQWGGDSRFFGATGKDRLSAFFKWFDTQFDSLRYTKLWNNGFLMFGTQEMVERHLPHIPLDPAAQSTWVMRIGEQFFCEPTKPLSLSRIGSSSSSCTSSDLPSASELENQRLDPKGKYVVRFNARDPALEKSIWAQVISVSRQEALNCFRKQYSPYPK